MASLTRPPWILRWPQVGLPFAIVSTSFLTAAAVGGLPGFRRALQSHLRATSQRCKAGSVTGLTGNTSAQRRRGISEESAANQNRSAGSSRTCGSDGAGPHSHAATRAAQRPSTPDGEARAPRNSRPLTPPAVILIR